MPCSSRRTENFVPRAMTHLSRRDDEGTSGFSGDFEEGFRNDCAGVNRCGVVAALHQSMVSECAPSLSRYQSRRWNIKKPAIVAGSGGPVLSRRRNVCAMEMLLRRSCTTTRARARLMRGYRNRLEGASMTNPAKATSGRWLLRQRCSSAALLSQLRVPLRRGSSTIVGMAATSLIRRPNALPPQPEMNNEQK